jgi:hypothetical protein
VEDSTLGLAAIRASHASILILLGKSRCRVSSVSNFYIFPSSRLPPISKSSFADPSFNEAWPEVQASCRMGQAQPLQYTRLAHPGQHEEHIVSRKRWHATIGQQVGGRRPRKISWLLPCAPVANLSFWVIATAILLQVRQAGDSVSKMQNKSSAINDEQAVRRNHGCVQASNRY